MIHAIGPGDLELMPSQWQGSKTMTRIQLCPPGDGQMDNVSPVPPVSIIDPRKMGEKRDVTDHNDPASERKVLHCCFYVHVCPHPGEEVVAIVPHSFRCTNSIRRSLREA